MIIAVHTKIYVEVDDNEQAEAACMTIDTGLERQMRSFPDGEVVQVDVEFSEPLSAEQIKEHGFEE